MKIEVVPPNLIDMRYLLLFLFILIFRSGVIASDLNKQELLTIVKNYSSIDCFYAQLNSFVFNNRTGQNGEKFASGFFCRNGSSFHSLFKSQECIRNSSALLYINHKTKKVEYMIKPNGSVSKLNNEILPEFVGLVNKSDSVTSSLLGDYTVFSVYLKGYIDRVDVFVDQHQFLKKFVYYFNKKSPEKFLEFDRMVLEYSNIKTSGVDSTMFSLDQFIELHNGKIRLRPAYHDYQITEHL